MEYWLKMELKTIKENVKDIVIPSSPELHARMAFCYGPLGEEIEFFQEY